MFLTLKSSYYSSNLSACNAMAKFCEWDQSYIAYVLVIYTIKVLLGQTGHVTEVTGPVSASKVVAYSDNIKIMWGL